MTTVEEVTPAATAPAGVCPECGKPFTDLTPEEVEQKLIDLEPMAVTLLEAQLTSRDQRVAQTAAVKLLEWKRGKPNQRIAQTTDQITTIRYESAAWMPEVIEVPEGQPKLVTEPPKELTP
jgi:hypothetical protein